jgi:hypothetical protein
LCFFKCVNFCVPLSPYAKATPAARATCDGGTSDVIDVYDAATDQWWGGCAS